MEPMSFDIPVSTTSTSRARSFGGCGTCRARHIKCDQLKPVCTNCASNGRECTGYTRRIFFDNENDGSNARYRQTLFSDEERQCMAETMTAGVSIEESSKVLTEIDESCEAAIERSDSILDIRRGPFSAFLFRPTAANSQATLAYEAPLTSPVPDNFDSDWTSNFAEGFDVPPVFMLDDNMSFSSRTTPTMDMLGNAQDFTWAEARIPTMEQCSLWSSPSSWNSFVAPKSPTQNAPMLLKHYADTFVPSLTPFRHAKTPWHILFLPNAMITMTAVQIGNDVDDASLTNLYGILAISALDIHHRSFNARWDVPVSMYTNYARENLARVLKHALDRPKRFKYKTTVMAILTMVQLSLLDGSWDQTESLLLEAEKVIRLRGLTKPEKSRKVRILHHCYAYIRIFHESLSLSSMQSKRRLAVMDIVQSSGTRPKSEDILSFRFVSRDNFDKAFEQLKDRDQGENDLHLSLPGIWPRTLYPEIFGISENWLSLLSQVIRLSNEKESESCDSGTRRLSLKEFTTRAKTLEILVLRWENTATNAVNLANSRNGAVNVDVDWVLLESLRHALRHALSVYFYRKIYDVEPEILQSKVANVKDSLIACSVSGEVSGRSLQGLLWSAFIAGCEALDLQLQSAFSQWFDSQIMQYRGSLSLRMRQTMQEVWDRRARGDSHSVTWLDRFGGV